MRRRNSPVARRQKSVKTIGMRRSAPPGALRPNIGRWPANRCVRAHRSGSCCLSRLASGREKQAACRSHRRMSSAPEMPGKWSSHRPCYAARPPIRSRLTHAHFFKKGKTMAEPGTFVLVAGAHASAIQGTCVMEAETVFGASFSSDSHPCIDPVIGAFCRNWNDSLRSDGERDRLLRPFIGRLAGTNDGPEMSSRRSWMVFDWLVRTCAAEFLSLSPGLVAHAQALRSLSEIRDANFDFAKLAAAGDAADAAWAAALDAAWAAAWDASGVAFRVASTAVATAAARAAASAAAWDAASAAASTAPCAAPWAGAQGRRPGTPPGTPPVPPPGTPDAALRRLSRCYRRAACQASSMR